MRRAARSRTAGGCARGARLAGRAAALGAALLLTYNKLRFDAWFDFGRHYQLTWIPFGSSTAFLPANVWSYALRPGALSCTFPYLLGVTDMGARAFRGGCQGRTATSSTSR